jgi:hypothetical protein
MPIACAISLSTQPLLNSARTSRSRRVMEKAGFRYECDIVHANLPHVLYRQVALGAALTAP